MDDASTEGTTTADLSVTLSGQGTGSVTASVGGINCGTACMATLPLDTVVTLTASPASSSTFTRWSGASCTTDPVCTVTLDGDKSITAEFGQLMRTVTVVATGNGTGTVTSTPAGISCPGSSCSMTVAEGSSITLSGVANSGSTFVGWSGATTCTGTTPCTFTVTGDTSINAGFALENSLLVALGGNGVGNVSSSPAGINCGNGGADCDEAYLAGTMVTLTAMADGESNFTGWTNGCGFTNPCTITVNASVMVTAQFTLKKYNLSVAIAGTGVGSVTGANINCPGDCMEDYDSGSTVTLMPMPDTVSSTFTGWSGACTGTAACNVTMNAMKAVTATFTRKTYNVTFSANGNGSIMGPGVDCGLDCTEIYNHGAMPTHTANPGTGYAFTSWSGGGCNGTNTNPCTTTITGIQSIIANFSITTHKLTIAKAGSSTGTVTATGINCGTDCDETFNYNSMIQLQAAPDMGAEFVGFTGGGCNGTTTCTVTMDTAKTVTATFNLTRHPLTVVRPGAGTGSVTSSPAGIICGGGGTTPDCTENYAYGTMVTLTAAPATGSTFTGWSSNCAAAGLTCTITINQMETVAANFAIAQHTLTVTREGTGAGTVTGPNINCPGDCTETYTYNSSVTLTATATAPSVFVGWRGACSGVGPCTVTMTADRSVRAVFSPPPNRMFVTSQTYVIGNLGGLSGADAKCQAAATAAALPGTYRAWLSSANANAIDRLGTASGWVRVDGKPFANTAADVAAHRIFHPGRITELGSDIVGGEVATATEEDGLYSGAGDCTGYTDTTGAGLRNGNAAAMGSTWTYASSQSCGTSMRLYCFGIDRAATVIPQLPGPARRAFMQLWTPGGGIAAADASCQADADANDLPGTYKALLATTTQSAISRFNTSTASPPWARVDDVLILPSAFAWTNTALMHFDSVPNLRADGAYSWNNYAHWSGASSLTATGTASTTCTNWTNPTQGALTGSSPYSVISTFLSLFGTGTPCSFNSATIVCMQE